MSAGWWWGFYFGGLVPTVVMLVGIGRLKGVLDLLIRIVASIGWPCTWIAFLWQASSDGFEWEDG